MQNKNDKHIKKNIDQLVIKEKEVRGDPFRLLLY